MSLNNRQKDIGGLLAEWREVTDKAYRGPWYAGTEEGVDYGSVIGYPVTGEDGYDRSPILVDDLSIYPGTAEFIAAARTAMPALLTAVENVLQLHRPRTVQCIYGDCAAEMCDHEDIEDCPTKDFQQCAECDRLADEVSTYYSETQAYLTEWPCVTVTAIRDAIGGAE